VVVHSREADEATLAELREHAQAWRGEPGRAGVLHCFAGDEAFARQLLDLGFHISFSGIVTFRNADALRAVARLVPDDRLLIETDTPLLAPVPVRGKRNEPAFLPHVAAKLAGVRGCSVERIAEITTANAEWLFGRGAAVVSER
jgi:TatD DNase family protein